MIATLCVQCQYLPGSTGGAKHRVHYVSDYSPPVTGQIRTNCETVNLEVHDYFISVKEVNSLVRYK